jgi:ABC-2 type transport system permease protein
MSAGRIIAVLKRHFFVFRRNPAGMLDLVLWPSVDVLIWGMLMVFIQSNARLPVPVGFLLGGVLMWTLMFRSNLETTISFLDDTSWTRNIINLLVSPMSPSEYLAGSALWALVKIGAGSTVMGLLTWVIFRFAVIDIGPVLGIFVFTLMLFGLAMSLVVMGIVLRFGHGADILAWGLAGMFTPLSAVWYPVSVMPGWAQSIALALPPAHVFESMRTVLAGGSVPWDRLALALTLDAGYLLLAFAFVRAMFGVFRSRGFVTRYM